MIHPRLERFPENDGTIRGARERSSQLCLPRAADQQEHGEEMVAALVVH
jgi:hypothetical protein